MYFATKPRIQPSRQSEAGLLKERTIHDFNRHSQEKRVYSKAMWDRKSLTYKLYEIKTLAAVHIPITICLQLATFLRETVPLICFS